MGGRRIRTCHYGVDPHRSMTSQSKAKTLLTPVHTDGSAEEEKEGLLTIATDCRCVKHSYNKVKSVKSPLLI